MVNRRSKLASKGLGRGSQVLSADRDAQQQGSERRMNNSNNVMVRAVKM